MLRALLRERGLDPDQIEVGGRPAGAEAAEAFQRGEADFLQAPAQVAEALVADGGGGDRARDGRARPARSRIARTVPAVPSWMGRPTCSGR